MSPAARSINIFGIYLVVISVVLLTAPNLLLFLFRLPLTTEVWKALASRGVTA
ncbi:MAG: hypothetical protein SF070_16280 [Gemmatimonadota bacterium]|nr:hypothetical protein [Gemmatimonadota bacterium]